MRRLSQAFRGCSSVGRAPGSHPGGQGFEPPQLHPLPRGVTGNTSDSGSEESRFEPWRGNSRHTVAVIRGSAPTTSLPQQSLQSPLPESGFTVGYTTPNCSRYVL